MGHFIRHGSNWKTYCVPTRVFPPHLQLHTFQGGPMIRFHSLSDTKYILRQFGNYSRLASRSLSLDLKPEENKIRNQEQKERGILLSSLFFFSFSYGFLSCRVQFGEKQLDTRQGWFRGKAIFRSSKCLFLWSQRNRHFFFFFTKENRSSLFWQRKSRSFEVEIKPYSQTLRLLFSSWLRVRFSSF